MLQPSVLTKKCSIKQKNCENQLIQPSKVQCEVKTGGIEVIFTFQAAAIF